MTGSERETCPVCRSPGVIVLANGMLRAHDEPTSWNDRGQRLPAKRCLGSGHPPDPAQVLARKLRVAYVSLRQDVHNCKIMYETAEKARLAAAQRSSVANTEHARACDNLAAFLRGAPGGRGVSEAMRRRAEEIGDRPDVVRWAKRLRRVLAEMPRDVWLFAASGTLCLMAKNEAGEHVDTGRLEGNDQDAVITTLPGECDGGDW